MNGRVVLGVFVLGMAFSGSGCGDPKPAHATHTCGNGVLEDGELCDAGANNSDTQPDACRATCQPPRCGDGVLDFAEICDKGSENADVAGALCRTDCRTPHCGDGVVDDGEDCDDGALNSDTDPDACRTDCRLAHCGDDVIDDGEACDNGTLNSDTKIDACRTSCRLASCGDGTIDTLEVCDKGTSNSDIKPNACRTDCFPAYCGDAVPDKDEECDNGEQNSDTKSDACRTDCVAAFCGDGVLDSSEPCDDGNYVDNDACDLSCAINDSAPWAITVAGVLVDATTLKVVVQGLDLGADASAVRIVLVGSDGKLLDLDANNFPDVLESPFAPAVSGQQRFGGAATFTKSPSTTVAAVRAVVVDAGGLVSNELESVVVPYATVPVDGVCDPYQLANACEAANVCEYSVSHASFTCDGQAGLACERPIELGVRGSWDGNTARYVGTTAAAPQSSVASCDPTPGTSGPEIIHLFKVAVRADVTLTTVDAATVFDTVLCVRTDCANPGTEIGCNNDAGAPQGPSTISLQDVAAGTSLFVQVDGDLATDSGAYGLSLTEYPLRASGERCDRSRTSDHCVTGLLCSQGSTFTECRAPTAPSVTSGEVVREADGTLRVVVTGADVSFDAASMEVTLYFQDGTAVDLDANSVPDVFSPAPSPVLSDRFHFSAAGLIPEVKALDPAPMRAAVVVRDATNLVSSPSRSVAVFIAAPTKVVLNEVLYNGAGTDSWTVFTEIWGPPGLNLTGYQLEGIKGDTGIAYRVLPLSGVVPATGYFVVASANAAGIALEDRDFTANVDWYNAAGDVVRLLDPTDGVVDAVMYGTPTFVGLVGEGSPAPTVGEGTSLSRDSRHSDTNDNLADFHPLAQPTPGGP